ncbi:MAG TPA: hypothetical protein VMF32_15720 [Xanthobacteraceae bacterium]|nr:hypothetical protein [Xanthobacteraceae bacterium]
MVPDANIWRAAALLIREHGGEAAVTAAKRAGEMRDQADWDGQRVWQRIRRAIVELPDIPERLGALAAPERTVQRLE